MKLNAVEIENYRSIKEVKINIPDISGKKAAIFIGLNESGKSNILKAINLLDKEKKADYSTDSNKEGKKTGKDIGVTYNFSCEDSQFHKNILLKDGFDKKIIDNLHIERITRYVKFDKDSNRRDSCHVFSVIDEKFFSGYLIKKPENLLARIEDVYSEPEPLTDDNIDSLLGSDYKIATRSSFETLIEEKYLDHIDQHLPKIILWRSADDKYLINKPIDLKKFQLDPEASQPLKNIFHIAGITDIKNIISLIEKDEEERFELEGQLSNSITKYINRVWKEHKINIQLRIEGMQCQVSVEDKDNTKAKFKMGQRSDGFKQFISILLNLSAENETETLKNTIIILDEPEVHLHPSGVKYLRDELLKISEKNHVIIATHSIYMVDKLNLNRHFQVTKDKSVTNISQIEPDNPYQEEVIYEALGTSVFEHISPNMLVLEGKTDKDIFDAFTYKFRTEIQPLNLGVISADGVDNILKYVKFFDGKLIKGFVLVDSDADGLRVRDVVIKENSQFFKKNTFDINSIKPVYDSCTLEDMFPRDVIIESVEKVYEVSLELEDNKPCMSQIKQKLRDRRMFDKKDNLKKLKSEITKRVIEYLNKTSSTKSKVKEDYPLYYDFLIKLHNKLKAA